MAYPSIISQPGSADRNYSPISEALRPWINQSTASSSFASSDKSHTSTTRPRARVLEIGSYPYAHIKRFATEFEGVDWFGSGRDEWEVNEIKSQKHDIANLHGPFQLDIAREEDWSTLREVVKSENQEAAFDGVVMLNVIHCCPEGTPEHIFKQLSRRDEGCQFLRQGGWVAVYGPYLADDGSYKSPGDEEFDINYIKAKDSGLGLRTIESITAYATKWGFQEVERKEMPKGNMWVVWKLISTLPTHSHASPL